MSLLSILQRKPKTSKKVLIDELMSMGVSFGGDNIHHPREFGGNMNKYTKACRDDSDGMKKMIEVKKNNIENLLRSQDGTIDPQSEIEIRKFLNEITKEFDRFNEKLKESFKSESEGSNMLLNNEMCYEYTLNNLGGFLAKLNELLSKIR